MKHKFNTAVVTADTIQAGTEDFKNPVFVFADMNEERKVQVDENTSFYSYDLAISMIENGDSVSSLVTKAIQLADLDGSLNKRLYEL